MNALRTRRLLAGTTLLLGLVAGGCSGGDAQDADTQAPNESTGGTSDAGTLEGDGSVQPPPGANRAPLDTGDDLDEPTP